MKYSSLTKIMRGAAATLFSVFALLLVPSFATAQTGNQAADRELKLWRLFEPAGGNFRVSLPTQPVASVLPFETDYSTLDIHVFTSRTTSSGYMISYIDIADISLKDAKAVEAAFDRVKTEIVARNPSAVPAGERKITSGRFPGRELVFDDGANNIKLQMFLVKQRGYIVEIVAPQTRNLPEALTKVYQAEADKFFNSFQILDNKKPEAPTKGKKTVK